jgi:hypothetical protein
MDCGAFALDMQETLKGASIALSISESPDLQKLGLATEHMIDAAVEIARQCLALGATLLYGGDLRPDGFTLMLADLAYRHRENKELAKKQPVLENILAWPVHMSMTSVDLEKVLTIDQRVVRTLLLDARGTLLV